MSSHVPTARRGGSHSSALNWTARLAAPATFLILLGALIFGQRRLASAYSLEGISWAPGTAINVSLQLGSHGAGQLIDGSANFDVVAQQAANLWNNYLGRNVRMVAVPTSQVGGTMTDQINSVFFDSTFFGMAFGSNVLAITNLQDDDSIGQATEFDVVFNTAVRWDSYRGPVRTTPLSITDLRRVVIHEFGHGLGLAHPDQEVPPQMVLAIMNSQISDIDIMQADDIAGMAAIYGPSVTPTPTPTPTPVPLGGQSLAGAVGHIYSSPGDPVGRGIEAMIDVTTGYSGAVYRRTDLDAAGRTLHRFIFPLNGAIGPGEWVFNIATPAGQDLADGTYDITSSDETNATRPYLVVSLEGGYSTIVAAQLILRGVTYAAGNLNALAADFRVTQSTDGGAPQFLAGQLRFNTPAVPLPPARIVNLSTRVNIGTGADQAITGVVFRDSSGVGKEAMVRVLGPTLISRGVTGTISDPIADLYSGSNVILSNDDWAYGVSMPFSVRQTGLAPPYRTETVLRNRFADGAFTAVVGGLDNNNQRLGTGVGLLEVYDLEIGSAASLINVSTRGTVGTGPNVMIAGVVIQGPGTKKVIIRAIGPSLTALGVPDALQNPTLQIYSGSTVIAQNDDYAQNSTNDRAAIAAKNLVPGDSRESAVYLVLSPGAYTAILSGVGTTTGVALVEVYDAD